MRKKIASIALGVGVTILATSVSPVARAVPRLLSVTQQKNLACCQPELLGLDEQIWGEKGQSGDWRSLLRSINHSLKYIQSPAAARAYRKYPIKGITRDRVWRSLVRFRQLVMKSRTPAELQAAVRREFDFYQSSGRNGRGEVLFTAYYEPIYLASRVPTAEFRYPLYRLPPNFAKLQHLTRWQLEGKDGLSGSKNRLRGLEIVWLRDRLEALLVQIQGSARLLLPDGKMMSLGYAGKTAHPYVSLGKELAKDGKLPLDGLTLPVLIDYFRRHPEELNNYIPRVRSFVFFRETHGAPATGSLGVPVTAERSIATDKSLMPPGALALMQTALPFASNFGQLEYRNVSRYVLDQDTGSAIKGAGRVDYFMGTGQLAGDRAGVTGSRGHLYYLLLKQ
ncbi:MltA domain-containing protein [Chroococcidiopsis sp. FACHB-1243]|uniref:murein transglycosylase A n=1 Tax=Chroococcidiopsis sp. [FACHB-1243] TaxID=2692781 RepID=UPI00177BB32A|nr:MltA domain-containing protein [Chroococcidiopsis sp. [FACHB-1243]]MBD2304728.1 MltA domain-containing protein [Chroococcidiopsis sp. [FACHB-1243]]